MNLLLDTGVLGQLCHPAKATNKSVSDWVTAILKSGSNDRVYLPELCDYELRRKLLHLIQKGQSSPRSIRRLDELGELLEYLPLDTETLRLAAQFWCDSRSRGAPTAANDSLDGDVILAAQAARIGGMIVTTNRKHLLQFVQAHDRVDILWAYAFVCIRGALENLAFDWPDHFIVQDSHGRSWHCRQEAIWHTLEEIGDTTSVLARLTSDASDIEPMYKKLFAAGLGSREPTVIRASVIMKPTPISDHELLEELAESLDEDSGAITSN